MAETRKVWFVYCKGLGYLTTIPGKYSHKFDRARIFTKECYAESAIKQSKRKQVSECTPIAFPCDVSISESTRLLISMGASPLED